MENIIEKITFSELEEILLDNGLSVYFNEIGGGPDNGGHYLIELDYLDTRCFVYYELAYRETDLLEVEEICLEALFKHDNPIEAEIINEINCLAIAGRLTIKDRDLLGCSLLISLKGGVTERHLAYRIEEWKRLVSRCKTFVDQSKTGIDRMNKQLSDLFSGRS